MAVTAQAGIFGFGPQGQKGTEASTYYKHKAMDIDLGPIDDTRLGALEIGSGPFPTFPYKAGYVVAGGADLQPRLEDTLGWLFYAAMGDLSTVQVGGDAAYDHTFKPLAADLSAVKWLSARKYIPKKDNNATTDLGEKFVDCKLLGINLAFENDQPVRARLDFEGLAYEPVPDPSGWGWGNAAYEDYQSVPVGCVAGGYVKFTGAGLTDEALPVVRAAVSIQNVPLDLRQEKIIGSPTPEDITVVERRVTFDLLVKWNKPDMYLAVQTNDFDGTAWSSTPLVGEVELYMLASSVIGATSHKYALTINAPEVMMQLNGPPTMAAGQAVMLRLLGTAIEPSSGSYTTVVIRNGVTSYSWPAGGVDALALDSSVPTDGGTGISVSADQTLTFNNQLIESAPTHVVLMKASDGSIVASTKTLSGSRLVVTINPTSNLSASTEYIISYAVEDIYGQSLVGAINFTTA
jgi:hypothetical protein